ncbi:hypothetical protein [Gordonia phthalatica]|uniref:hypothetical protein n=1 Tax=Gordonia phthalatica TaxID=1136941 RepID=UPI000781E643
MGDVVDHVLTVTDKFTQFAAGRTDAPRGQRRRPVDRRAALSATILESRAAWSSVDPVRVCHLPFGDFQAHEAAAINCADVLLHAWDVARGTGLEHSIPAELVPQALATIQRLASDEAVRDGHYARPPTEVRGATADMLLIASGRSPTWPDR